MGLEIGVSCRHPNKVMKRVLFATSILSALLFANCSKGATGVPPNEPMALNTPGVAATEIVAIENVQGTDPKAPAMTEDDDAPVNVKALPSNWSEELVFDYMVTITQDLGVKCDFCHVGGEPESDKLPNKLAARKMISMTIGLNKQFFSEESPITCATCHKGKATPQ